MINVLEKPLNAGLELLPIMGVSAQGAPILPGVKQSALTVIEPLPPSRTSGFAVCKSFGENQIAVLGYLDHDAVVAAHATQTTPDQVTIRNGKSAIHLHADGRVWIEGEDVKITSHARLALDGAYIELN